MTTGLFYVFIVSSLDHPVYRELHGMRKQLLLKYNVSYTVLMNEDESCLNDASSPTLVPMQSDEILFPRSGMSPFMTQKFLSAVKMYFRSFPNWSSVPPYIVRINATVYIHWPTFTEIVNSLPREGLIAGPCHTSDCLPFMNGMVLVFSKDVLRRVLEDPRIYDKLLMRQPDDVVLTQLANPYATTKVNLIDYFVHPHMNFTEYEIGNHTDEEGMYRLDVIQPRDNNKCIYRIARKSNRSIDVKNWQLLLHYYKEEVGDIQENYTPSSWSTKDKVFLGLAILLLLVIFVVICCTKNDQ